jgi:CubicO group peptidase (beta-lactamase class C family)
LVEACDTQHEVFAEGFDVLRRAIGQRAFPGASVAITQSGNLLALEGLGRYTYDPASPAVTAETIFDLASVTKVIATAAMAMLLFDRGLLDLAAPVIEILPEFTSSDPRRSQVTLRMLLAHSSGLPAYERLFLRANTKEALIRDALTVPLKYDPGTHAEYSDIGFILLGVALERIAGKSLDGFCETEIFQRLGLSHTRFNPPAGWKHDIAPTADDKTFRHRIIQGEVQDENASVMCGVSAHAGVFAPARDIAAFAHAMLSLDSRLASESSFTRFTSREANPPGTSRALGWDTPSQPSQSGQYFSPNSYGHLGYTGTSLWIDPERELSVTLLTNRTWPDCSNPAIREIRPRFHDAVIEALLQTATRK